MASSLRRLRSLWVLAGFAIAATALAGIWWLHRHSAVSIDPKDTIVLADFTNNTDDPALGETLRRGLVVQLEQSPVLRLLPDPRTRATLRLMGLPEQTQVTPKIGEEICQRTGSRILLSGLVMKNGDGFILATEAMRCLSGDTILRAQEQVARKEALLNAASAMATRLRERMGEPQQSSG